MTYKKYLKLVHTYVGKFQNKFKNIDQNGLVHVRNKI